MQAPASLAIEQWHTIYNIGHYFAPLAILGALATGYTAYYRMYTLPIYLCASFCCLSFRITKKDDRES
jgi:hypothetical protein